MVPCAVCRPALLLVQLDDQLDSTFEVGDSFFLASIWRGCEYVGGWMCTSDKQMANRLCTAWHMLIVMRPDS